MISPAAPYVNWRETPYAPILSRLSVWDRIRAYDAFDEAASSRRLAHWCRRNKTFGWKMDFLLEMRRARKSWNRYASFVRKAKSWRAAA